MTDTGETQRRPPQGDDLRSRVAHAARAILRDRLGARRRRSLRRLTDVHPPASQAGGRWRGLGVVPVSAIVGTASALPGARRADFLPVAGHEPADWRVRWTRLEAAARSLTPLPPVELVKAGDGYWVVDGHNRVALARSTGQLWIDADVTEVVLSPVDTPIIPTLRGTT